MVDRLKDKVAVVTGGGGGIGRAVCLAFAAEGARVAVCDVRPESAETVAKEINKLGGRAIACLVDVRDKAHLEAAVSRTVAEYSKIDILVNSAGITRDLPVHKMTEKDWDDVLDICLKGSFLATQAVTNWMVPFAKQSQKEGQPLPTRKIINITSGAVRGNAGQANYSAAKAGVIGLTRSNAREFAKFNILVNAVSPLAATEMTRGLEEHFKQRAMLGRIGDPSADISPAFVFLASDDSNYITGQVLGVNGGLDTQY